MQKKPTVLKATLEDFESIYPLLVTLNNNITKEQWKNLFIDHWHFQEGYCGYKLVLGGETVGFIAYILSKKFINGGWEKFCNMSTWVVKPEFRSSSIDLLYPLLELKDHTVISFTPTPGAYKVESKLFKLKFLDGYEAIMPALPKLSAVLGRPFKVITLGKRPASAASDLVEALPDYEKKVVQDHEKFGCFHVVLDSGKIPVYLIFKKIVKRHLPFFKLYYASDLDFFLKHLEDIRFRIPLALKGAGLVVDSRFLKDQPVRFRKNKNFHIPMIYKSAYLKPHEIDYLYSEFFLLGF